MTPFTLWTELSILIKRWEEFYFLLFCTVNSKCWCRKYLEIVVFESLCYVVTKKKGKGFWVTHYPVFLYFLKIVRFFIYYYIWNIFSSLPVWYHGCGSVFVFLFYFNIYSFIGEEPRYLDPPKDHRGAYIFVPEVSLTQMSMTAKYIFFLSWFLAEKCGDFIKSRLVPCLLVRR